MDRLQAALADRYTIERQIGSGEMAFVFLAEDSTGSASLRVESPPGAA